MNRFFISLLCTNNQHTSQSHLWAEWSKSKMAPTAPHWIQECIYEVVSTSSNYGRRAPDRRCPETALALPPRRRPRNAEISLHRVSRSLACPLLRPPPTVDDGGIPQILSCDDHSGASLVCQEYGEHDDDLARHRNATTNAPRNTEWSLRYVTRRRWRTGRGRTGSCRC